jgi:hypothetical protein
MVRKGASAPSYRSPSLPPYRPAAHSGDQTRGPAIASPTACNDRDRRADSRYPGNPSPPGSSLEEAHQRASRPAHQCSWQMQSICAPVETGMPLRHEQVCNDYPEQSCYPQQVRLPRDAGRSPTSATTAGLPASGAASLHASAVLDASGMRDLRLLHCRRSQTANRYPTSM